MHVTFSDENSVVHCARVLAAEPVPPYMPNQPPVWGFLLLLMDDPHNPGPMLSKLASDCQVLGACVSFAH